MHVNVWCIYLWTSSLDPDAWMYDARMYDYISMILVPWPWCMYDTWMYDAHIHDICPWCMYDAKMYDAHIRDPCPWSWFMHDACILVLECMMHTPAAAPPIENRIKKRHRHTFNGRSSSRSGQGFYGVGIAIVFLIMITIITSIMVINCLDDHDRHLGEPGLRAILAPLGRLG